MVSSVIIANVNLAVNSLREDDESPVEKQRPAQEFFEDLKVALIAFKLNSINRLAFSSCTLSSICQLTSGSEL